jgi:hypothetical protein
MPYWKLYYHFIWGTKNRLPLIDPTGEYGVLSFGEKNLPGIVLYTHNQKKHHAEGTLIATMERMDER